jgi:murein DD-endopeptidase MepM/ murein hydrolase activator NlpD
VVWSTANSPRGWTVVIDHESRKLATYDTHLSSLLVTAKQPVRAGTPLGIIGADPLDGAHVMHLHLEVWRGSEERRFDPQRVIETSWEYVPIRVTCRASWLRATAPTGRSTNRATRFP